MLVVGGELSFVPIFFKLFYAFLCRFLPENKFKASYLPIADRLKI